MEAAQRWPQVRASYRLACVRGQVRFEDPLWLPHPEDETRWVVCVVTKWHWWDKSVLADVRTSVRALLRGVKARNVETLALPALGAGLGGLDFVVVRAMLEVEVGELADRVELYEPGANR